MSKGASRPREKTPDQETLSHAQGRVASTDCKAFGPALLASRRRPERSRAFPRFYRRPETLESSCFVGRMLLQSARCLHSNSPVFGSPGPTHQGTEL
jgi:hypothetical protein